MRAFFFEFLRHYVCFFSSPASLSDVWRSGVPSSQRSAPEKRLALVRGAESVLDAAVRLGEGTVIEQVAPPRSPVSRFFLVRETSVSFLIARRCAAVFGMPSCHFWYRAPCLQKKMRSTWNSAFLLSACFFFLQSEAYRPALHSLLGRISHVLETIDSTDAPLRVAVNVELARADQQADFAEKVPCLRNFLFVNRQPT